MQKPLFRTLSFSDPAYEFGGLRFVTVKSATLGHRADVCVFVPQGHTGEDLPVVLLLHGVYGSHWGWAMKGGVHLTAQRMIDEGEIPPMVLAMPSDGLWGDGSAYLPKGKANYEKWIAEDVPALLISEFPAVSEQSPFFIAGLSMGGFGALRIGVKYHQRFRAAAGHSSVTTAALLQQFVEENPELHQTENPDDQSVLATILANRQNLIPLRFDCGVDDTLLPHNRELHESLEKEGIPHEYQEYPGEHTWDYWAEHVKKTLRFFGGLC
ncbi:MAG: alpha/beta hydrolase-fold protein [Bacteroidia bacterium]